MRKSGNYSLEDIEYMRQNAQKIPVVDIAKHLGRNPKTVKKYIQRKGWDIRTTEDVKKFAQSSLEENVHWKSIRDKYTPEEQSRCIQQYTDIVSQFNNEIFATEVFQIFDYLNLDVKLQRIGFQEKEIYDGLSKIKIIVEKLYKKKSDLTEEQIEHLSTLEQAISTKEINLKEIARQTIDINKQKNEILKTLKATRDQRLSRIEQGNKTLTGLMADLLSDPKKMKEIGIELEKHRLACEVEMIRLGELHTYSDGEVDFPVLTSDTVKNFYREDEVGEEDYTDDKIVEEIEEVETIEEDN